MRVRLERTSSRATADFADFPGSVAVRLTIRAGRAHPGSPSRFPAPLLPVPVRPATRPEHDLRYGGFRPGRVRAVLHAMCLLLIPNIVVEQIWLLEIKAVHSIHPLHETQLLTHLKESGLRPAVRNAIESRFQLSLVRFAR